MKEEQKTKEKACAFYASDYHFEMMSLPYINNNLEKNKEIIILTENNLEETINKVISRMNLQQEKKEKILEINWKEDNTDKIKKVEQLSQTNKEAIIFIKGKEKYIKKTNENIKEWTKENEKIKLIDCYDIEEISEEVNDIIARYERVLTTSGERKINKI